MIYPDEQTKARVINYVKSLQNPDSSTQKNVDNTKEKPGNTKDNLTDEQETGIAEVHLTSNQKAKLFDYMNRHIEKHITDQLKEGVSESEIKKELLSEHSSHRAKALGALEANLRDFENRANDMKHKRLTVERIDEKTGLSDKQINEKYNSMINNLREMIDYGGILYHEIAINRAGTKGLAGGDLQLLSWADAERQRDEREGIRFTENGGEVTTKHSEKNQGAFSFEEKVQSALKKDPTVKNLHGTGDTTLKNFVADEKLTSQQKLLKNFSGQMGLTLQFFKNDNADFRGAYTNGVTYLNVNSNIPLGQVFWHETLHWLKSNNPKLFKNLADATNLSDAQLQNYLEETGRKDLKNRARVTTLQKDT